MDAHLFRRYCEDLLPALIGCRIEKIYQTAEGVITFSLYGLGKLRQKFFPDFPNVFSSQKYYLTYKEGREGTFFVSHGRVSQSAEPPAFVMRLRKYLAGRHIKSAAADWIQRKIFLEVQDVWLSIDIRSGLELHFSCPQGALRSPEGEYLDFEESYSLKPALSDRDFSRYWADFEKICDAGNKEVWQEYPTLTPLLRKTLPYLCGEEQAALYADLQYGGGDVFVYTQNSRSVKFNQSVENNPLSFARNDDKYLLSAWKLPPELLRQMGYSAEAKELVFENAVEASLYAGDMVLAKFQKQTKAESIKQLQNQLKKLAKLEIKLEEEEKRLTRLADMKNLALLLQANLYRFKPDERAEWADVCNFDGDSIRIELDKAKTVRENMENYFHAGARGARGLEHLVLRRQELERDRQNILNRMWEEDAGAAIKEPKQPKERKEEIDYGLLGKIRNVNNKAKFSQTVQSKKTKEKIQAKYPKEVQVFRSSDGFMILRGRDTKGNGLVLKMASPYDIWVHIAEGASAHVIVKRDHAKQEIPPQTMQEAGALALLKSHAKTQETGLVQYSYAKYIRPMKNAAQGLVHVDKSEGTLSIKIDPSYEESLKI